MIYPDSSVALAHLLAEDRFPAEDLWRQQLVSSRLLEYEVWNRIHARGLDRSHGDAVRALIGSVALLELAPPVLARALDPFPIPVRTLDALHLSSIDFLRQRQQQVEPASFNERLIAGARAEASGRVHRRERRRRGGKQASNSSTKTVAARGDGSKRVSIRRVRRRSLEPTYDCGRGSQNHPENLRLACASRRHAELTPTILHPKTANDGRAPPRAQAQGHCRRRTAPAGPRAKLRSSFARANRSFHVRSASRSCAGSPPAAGVEGHFRPSLILSVWPICTIQPRYDFRSLPRRIGSWGTVMGLDTGRVFKRPVLCPHCNEEYLFTLRAIADNPELRCYGCGGTICLRDSIFEQLVSDVRNSLEAIAAAPPSFISARPRSAV